MTDSNNESSESKTMTIVEDCIPPLKAGEYTIAVQQTIEGDDGKEISGKNGKPTFSKEQTFHVSAPRFNLDSFDIYSVYPPAGAVGRFSATLPHIVLTRRTLPWERPLKNGATAPWMALLLLDEDDLRMEKDKPELRELKSLSLDKIPRFKDKLEPWEKNEDICNTIDVPVEIFTKIVPSIKDLPYLAHARKVGTDDMESDSIEDEGWFSVVIGNRLPTPNKENRVYLVSLEGLEGYIPNNTQKNQNTDSQEDIRLVVLTSWSFVDHTEGKGFYELAKSLTDNENIAPLKIQSPDTVQKEIKTALDYGYVPLNQTTRQGYKAMSWYRGPFTPHFLPTDPENIVYSHADAALRFDKNMGLFDVSYAAAWQLGRLLGIKNQHFARALYTFVNQRIQTAAEEIARTTVQQKFGSQNSSTMEELMHEFLGNLDFESINGNGQTDRTPNKNKSQDDIPNYSERLQHELEKENDADEIPPEIREWLGRLFVLHGVPINYLIPHPKVLEEESLRFFYVDTTWVGALLDGALSIGRSSESRLFLDKAMAGNFLNVVLEDCGIKLLKKNKKVEVIGHITGFLLRSALVSGWRGLEVIAKDQNEKKLRALRMERITRDTLLCIYNGQVKQVVINQPRHALHFGVVEENEEFKKEISGNDGNNHEIPVPMRETSRVVDIYQLAMDFYQLAKDKDNEKNRAEFAKAMIEKPVQCTIDIDYKEV